MIRKLAFVLLILVLGAIGFLGFSIYGQLQEKQAVKERIATLPEFSVVGLDGETVRSNDAAGQSPLVLTYFNTGCKFCKAEIRSMQQHKNLREISNIYLVSDEQPVVLKRFAKDFKLDSLKTVRVLYDSSKQVKKLFGIRGVPTTFVYNEDDKLLKSFKGETKAELVYELVKE